MQERMMHSCLELALENTGLQDLKLMLSQIKIVLILTHQIKTQSSRRIFPMMNYQPKLMSMVTDSGSDI